MADWIEQLERLTNLHKAGALTDAEFAAQKARLLAAQDQPAAPPVETQPPAPVAEARYAEYDEPVRGGVPKLVLFGLPALLALGAAAWFGSTLVSSKTDPELTGAGAASGIATEAAAAVATASEEAPMPVELEGSLTFAAANQCTAAPTLEQIYKKLDAAGNLGSGRGMSVTLGSFETPLAIQAKANTDKEGIESKEASLRFPENTTWHGLRISRLTSLTTIVPESDGGYQRTMTFLESPDKVQRTLARLGFGAPKAPDYAELTDEGCGGSMQVTAVAGGAALQCNWGC